MATDVAPPVRSEVLEAFDLTMAQSVHCGRFAALLDEDTERNREHDAGDVSASHGRNMRCMILAWTGTRCGFSDS